MPVDAGHPRGAGGNIVMFTQGGPVKVFLATRPVDFRKGSEEGQKTVQWTVFPTNGLASAVQEMFELDPFCGAVPRHGA